MRLYGVVEAGSNRCLALIYISLNKIVDPKTGDEKPVTISVDDGIRPNASIADLAKLKPVFKKDGSTTAGNSSQVSDGAGAVLLMKGSVAMKKGLPILGVFRTFAAVGVDPEIMGVGPAIAIPTAVKSAGLELDDIDLFEINEAFASQFVYFRKKLELDPEKINVNGGAMAIGHPLGATERVPFRNPSQIPVKVKLGDFTRKGCLIITGGFRLTLN